VRLRQFDAEARSAFEAYYLFHRSESLNSRSWPCKIIESLPDVADTAAERNTRLKNNRKFRDNTEPQGKFG
jgi:hypothetical protein